MHRLERKDLWTLEQYAQEREEFRRRVIAHKRERTLHIGPNLTLLFEDRLTIQYQVQEMLRAERIFEPAGIRDELESYNPLIPDGRNWKATLLVEFTDVAERQLALAKLIGIEDQVWLQVAGQARLLPFADEDMQRETDSKTSAVHFLRYELTPEMVNALKGGGALNAGANHPEYRHELKPVPDALRKSLLADLD